MSMRYHEPERFKGVQFPFSKAQVGDALLARVTFHLDRITYWQGEKARCDEILSVAKPVFREEHYTGGSRMVPVYLDEDFIAYKRAETAQSKIAGHEAKLQQYQALQAGLMRWDANESVPLTLDDIAWLGLDGSTPESDEDGDD